MTPHNGYLQEFELIQLRDCVGHESTKVDCTGFLLQRLDSQHVFESVGFGIEVVHLLVFPFAQPLHTRKGTPHQTLQLRYQCCGVRDVFPLLQFDLVSSSANGSCQLASLELAHHFWTPNDAGKVCVGEDVVGALESCLEGFDIVEVSFDDVDARFGDLDCRV